MKPIVIIIREPIGYIAGYEMPFSHLQDSFEDWQFKYIDVTGGEMRNNPDNYITRLINDYTSDNVSFLFIPTFLGIPVLYNGVRFGMHWRLQNFDKGVGKIPIIFLGFEDEIELYKNCSYSGFINTPNVYYIQYNEASIKKFLNSYKNRDINKLSFNRSLKDYGITYPIAYEDYHSFANEWSILRWAEILGIKNEKLDALKLKSGSSLYYKYLRARYPINQSNEILTYKIKGEGRLLYIDDEWDKGWFIIFEQLFKPSNLKLEVLKETYKNYEEKEIIEKCEYIIKNNLPDIILLDLRLSPNDFDSRKTPKELTGYKVLKIIKEINPGIQVIIFTASNKVWNLIELQNVGADGFTLKESPENEFNVTSHEISTIDHFINTINDRLKYKFEKGLFLKCKNIHDMLQKQDNVENPKYMKFIKSLRKQLSVIEVAISSINLGRKITLDIAFLSFYNFLELFKKYYLKFDNRDYRYYLGYENIPLRRYSINQELVMDEGVFVANNKYDSPSWFITIAALFIDYFGISRTGKDEMIINLSEIKDKRNGYIHSTKASFEIYELELITEAVYLSCKNIKE